ncbi:MAG: TonB-dependent receptor [Bacteroidaceae bacterium]|nr:TonB-dependent receptor [Bacteroidaceae bacterium]
MGKKLWLFIACALISTSMAFAQKTVTGTVIEAETGEPVIGASVRVDGTSLGQATDIDGKFSIANVPNSAKNLQVSYVGLKTKVVPIRPSQTISMESDAKALKEVFIVAFGTATKETYTGSASVVGAEDIEGSMSTNVVDALKGKAAGVQMFTASGQPGQSSPTIRIRGYSSINAGNQPLIILDGAPYEGDLNTINSADIESMTVQKDAASNALYGNRGANGVIMITTKKAQYGNAKITVDAKWGVNSRSTQRYKTINDPAQYYEMWYKGLYNKAISDGKTPDQAYVWANQNLIDGPNGLQYNVYSIPEGQYLVGTDGKLNSNATMGRLAADSYGNQYWLQADDWLDEAYKTGFRQEYTVTASQATSNSNFYASFGYLTNEGITVNSDYKRLTGRMKADVQLKDWLKIGGNMSYTHYNSNMMSEDGSSNSSGNIFAVSSQMAPIYPLYIRNADGSIRYDSDGNIRYDYGDKENAGLERPSYTSTNAVSDATLDTNEGNGNAFTVLGFAEFRFLKDFKFTTTNSGTIDEYRATSVTNPYYGTYASSNGILGKAHSRSNAWNIEQSLNWHHEFGLHDVEVLAAHENYRRKYYYLYAGKTNMFDPKNTELDGAVTDGSNSSYTTDYITEGWLGRAMYNYDKKYFAMVSYRRDASSRFSVDNRWGNFLSGSAAWNISNENWFHASWVDLLKIRASYGENGNDNIGNYRYITTYEIKNGAGNVGAIPYLKGNNDITWETVKNADAGIDFELFNGRLSGTFDLFYRKTQDMLLSFPLAPTFGFTSYYANVGDMVNKGIEFSIDATPVETKDFSWNIYANITAYKNEISYLPTQRKTMSCDGADGYSSSNYFYGEGEAMYTFRLFKYAGLDEKGNSTWVTAKPVANPYYDENDPSHGPKMVNWTNDYTYLSTEDYFLCGSAQPDAYGGFGTALSFKGFDFSIDFNYQLGGKVYDSDYALLMANPDANTKGGAFHADLLNAWTESNHTDIPAFMYTASSDLAYYSGSSSDRWLEDASFLAINKIQFGYTFPAVLTRMAGIEKCRLYVAADNVALWSARQGLDPRQSVNGATTNAYYAPMRNISGGITLTF